MPFSCTPWRCVASLLLMLAPGLRIPLVAQPGARAALRKTPAVAWASTLGFRDWSAAVDGGGLIVASNLSGKGGLFAVDAATGRLRWRTGTERTAIAPVSDGRVVVVAWAQADAIAAYDLATGKPLWRKPFEFVSETGITFAGGVVLAQHENGALYALDAATGSERWARPLTSGPCWCGASRPVVAGDVVYVASGRQPPADARADYFLHAIDLATGQERWRYNPPGEYPNRGVCLTRIVAAGDVVVSTGDGYLYGVDRQSGRQRYRSEVLDGATRRPLFGLVGGNELLFAMNQSALIAIAPDTGRTSWRLPGAYRDGFDAMATADNVLYFQGHVKDVDPEPAPRGGTLHAIDVTTREVLWSFTHATEEPWPFGAVLPIEGGLYVDTHKTLLKLH